MRALTPHEQRTIRIGGVVVAALLLLLGGLQVCKYLAHRRTEYRQLLQQADDLKQQIHIYEERTVLLKKLMEDFQLDPGKLSRATLMADASAAIQRAATSSGLQPGPVRESPSRPSNKELASLQMEASGPVPSAMSLLGRLQTVGFPLLIDSVQITPEPTRPGQIKLHLTILILDFDQWKTEERPNA
jgi:hypothetical protein